jgi:GT2 family glycosyltransferase
LSSRHAPARFFRKRSLAVRAEQQTRFADTAVQPMTSLRSIFATAGRAYRYGGAIELLGCVIDGVKSALVPIAARAIDLSVPTRFWPRFSPELLAFEAYRQGAWASLDLRERRWRPVSTLRELCDVALDQKSLVWRLDSATQPAPSHRLGRNFSTLLARDDDREVLTHYFRKLYDEPDVSLISIEGLPREHYLIQPVNGFDRPVSVVIPTRDNVELLKQAVDAVVDRGGCNRVELIIVDNGSVHPETETYLRGLTGTFDLRVIPDRGTFNWSRLNNLAASTVSTSPGGVLVFLNNDIEAKQDGWLARLVSFAALSGVGCVGPMLLYPDGSIQHAGVVIGMGRWADHVYKATDPDIGLESTPFVPPSVTRPVLAVTGACMAITKANFDLLGGFDESFQIVFSDVELCVRAHNKGLRNLYLGDVRLVHHESKSRDPKAVPDEDFHRARKTLRPYRTEKTDPYFHPRLDKLSITPKSIYLPTNLSKWLRQ